MRYLWGVLLRAYLEFEERVGQITTGRGAKTAYIRRLVDRKVGSFAISEIDAECPWISRDMIRVVLRRLRDEELLEVHGKGRGAKWRKRD